MSPFCKDVGRPAFGTKSDALILREGLGINSREFGLSVVDSGSCLVGNINPRGLNSVELGLRVVEEGVNSAAEGLSGLCELNFVEVPTVKFFTASFSSTTVCEGLFSDSFALSTWREGGEGGECVCV